MTDTHITVSGDTIGVEHLVLTDSAHDHLHLRTRPTIRPQALIRLESRLVATDEPIRRIQHVAEGAEVLLDPQPWWSTRCPRPEVMPWWQAETPIELTEGGEAGTTEPIDALVVVETPQSRPVIRIDDLARRRSHRSQ